MRHGFYFVSCLMASSDWGNRFVFLLIRQFLVPFGKSARGFKFCFDDCRSLFLLLLLIRGLEDFPAHWCLGLGWGTSTRLDLDSRLLFGGQIPVQMVRKVNIFVCFFSRQVYP